MKTHTFSWILSEDWRWKWKFLEWRWQFWERERRRRQRERHMMRGKLKIFWKTVWVLTLFVQNKQFLPLNWLASESPNWVAKIPSTRFWKFSLSLFRDWDFHSPVSCERLWMNLWLANESPKSQKPRFLKNFLSVFCYLNSYSPVSREPFWVNLQLKPWKLVSHEWVAKRQRWKFLDLLKFFEIKHFLKTTKILKNLFWFDQHMLEYVHHI